MCVFFWGLHFYDIAKIAIVKVPLCYPLFLSFCFSLTLKTIHAKIPF